MLKVSHLERPDVGATPRANPGGFNEDFIDTSLVSTWHRDRRERPF
jgi:hypothetical protein